MRYDRDDDMTITGKRHDFRIDYRAGVDAQGRLTGVDFTQMARCGWAMDLSLPVADRAMLHADNAYHLPAARITSHRLKTHTQSATAFRGFGGPQGLLGIERVMDHVAHVLGWTRWTVRRANYYADAPVERGGAVCPQPMRPKATPPRVFPQRRRQGRARISRYGSAAKLWRGAFAETGRRPQTTPYHMEVRDFILNGMTDRLPKAATTTARRARLPSGTRASRC